MSNWVDFAAIKQGVPLGRVLQRYNVKLHRGGSVLDFVAAMEGCTLREAALRLQQEALVPGAPAAPGHDGKQLVTKKRGTPAALGFTLGGVDSTHPYLAARGIQRPTAEEFGVGSYRGPGIFSDRLVIPIHNQRGELVAYCGRALDHSQPRYGFPPGFAKSEILLTFTAPPRKNPPWS